MSAQLITNPFFRFFTFSGTLEGMSGGYMETKVPGTDTDKATYDGTDGLTPLPNPITFDADGSPIDSGGNKTGIYGIGTYLLKLYNADDELIDEITGSAGEGGDLSGCLFIDGSNTPTAAMDWNNEDLTNVGDLDAANGSFSADIDAVNGSFSGDIDAVNADLSGTLNLDGLTASRCMFTNASKDVVSLPDAAVPWNSQDLTGVKDLAAATGAFTSTLEADGVVTCNNNLVVSTDNDNQSVVMSFPTTTDFQMRLMTTGSFTIQIAGTDTQAFRVWDGTRDYINIDTDTEKVSICNASTNPDFEVLGTGTVTFGGDVQIAATKDLDCYTNGGYFKPRRVSQSTIPTPDANELMVWRDSDDSKTYIVYNDANEGIRSVEMV